MFVPSLRCESWRGFLSPVDSTKSGWIAQRAVDGAKGRRTERRMGGQNDEQKGQGKREENGGVGYKKKVAEATLESVGTVTFCWSGPPSPPWHSLRD